MTLHKGGVAKTTTVVSLADALRRGGYRILVIDLDPQANCSKTLGESHPTAVGQTVRDLLLDDDNNIKVRDLIHPTKLPDVSLVYSSIKLGPVDFHIRANDPQPAQRLQRKLEEDLPYDFILFDTPPHLGLFLLNALVASHHFIIPLQAGDKYSFDGLTDLVQFVGNAKRINTNLNLLGMLITMYDSRQSACKEILKSAREEYGEDVFNTVITNSTAVRKANLEGKTVLQFERSSPAAKDYMSLAEEICHRLGWPTRRTLGESAGRGPSILPPGGIASTSA